MMGGKSHPRAAIDHTTGHQPDRDEGESSRKRRLKAINAFLEERGLRSFSRIGNWKLGETELVRATGAVHENPWYSILGFQVIKPDGNEGFFNLRFHAHGGQLAPMVVVPEINGDIHAFSREYRVACSDWFTEYPRAFAVSQGHRTPHEKRLHALAQTTPLGRERPYEALPLCVLARKLTQITAFGSLSISGIELTPHLLAHDTGFDTAQAELWIVRMQVDPAELAQVEGTPAMRIVTHTLREIVEGKVVIRDAMTEAALFRYLRATGRIRC